METLKKTTFYLITLITAPLILITKISIVIGIEETFVFFAQMLSMVPGKLGSYFRVSFYHFTTTSTTIQCFIGFGTFFSKRNVKIEKGVSIGAYCVIGSVEIGEETLIASKVSIPSGRHQHSDDIPEDKKRGPMKTETIKVGAHCWIGENALILANVGNNSIIGGGSVVVKNIPENMVAAGNPAKLLKTNART